MFKKPMTIWLILTFLAPTLAKGEDKITGEEELFVKDQPQENGKFKKGFELTLGFEFDWIQAYGYSKKLFRMDDKAYEARFPVAASYLLSEDSKIYLVVPYICKYAFVGYHSFSGTEEWEFAMGLGDIRGGISYQIMKQGPQSVNIQVSAEVISNTGRVHYGPLADRAFGNGYWNIASGAGISRTVYPRFIAFGNLGYVYRLRKSGESIYIYDEDYVLERIVKYKPPNIKFYGLGIASLIGQNSWLGLEVQHTIGIETGKGHGSESRLGISVREVKNGVLTDRLFLGKGWLSNSKENTDYWLLAWTLPVRLRIFGVSF